MDLLDIGFVQCQTQNMINPTTSFLGCSHRFPNGAKRIVAWEQCQERIKWLQQYRQEQINIKSWVCPFQPLKRVSCFFCF